jgi:phosphonate transport system substrate-binding protein
VEYLLLVRRDHPATQPADLRGASLVMLTTPSASVAPVWLETLLLEARAGTIDSVFGRVTRTTRISQVILPVFFRKADACVVTRDAFQTMVELNPQLGRELKVLARSPDLVAAFTCFPGEMHSPYAEKLLANLDRIIDSPTGRQTLVLFHTDRIVARPLSDLDGTFALVERHERLLAAVNRPVADAPLAPVAQGEREPLK